MARSFKTFTDALTAAPVAANDNKPAANQPKPKRIRNNTTLPALRWLYDNHPELAEPVAAAVRSLVRTAWDAEAVDSDMEFRPTVGEIVRAASAGEGELGKPRWLSPVLKHDAHGRTRIRVGDLEFDGNVLVEYGKTRKGRKLEPRERLTARSNAKGGERNPNSYVFGLRGAVASPMHVEHLHRTMSDEPALAPMYDPQRGVEAARAELQAHGADGSVPFEQLPIVANRHPAAIADGAEFLGGVVGLSGTGSGGAQMWEARDVPKGEAQWVIEEVAARGTLQSIGGGDIETGKAKLIDAARLLKAANDNKHQKVRAA